MRVKAFVAGAVAAMVAAGPAYADQHYRVVAKDPKAGATIQVPNGDDLQLKLTACEDCGFRWKITKKPDAAVIAFERRQSSVSQCSAPCTGGNATERWLFQSNAIGSTVVKLGYFGPGKSKPSKVRRFTLDVVS